MVDIYFAKFALKDGSLTTTHVLYVGIYFADTHSKIFLKSNISYRLID